MTSFKRWFGAGAIVVVALALVACPAMVPKPTGQILDMTFEHGAKATTVTDLGRFFDEDQNAKYGAASSDSAVATATVADTTLTVTPGAAGTATVTVTATASNGRDTAEQNFKVTVKPAPKPPDPPDPPDPPTNSAPTLKTLKDVGLAVGGAEAVDLSAYAADADGDALSYTAVSSDLAIATATVSGSTAMIAGAAAGTATITVTVTDDKSASVSGTFKVTVAATPPDNRAPVVLTSNVIAPVDAADFRVGMTKTYTLSAHFQDPDADVLTYDAMSSNSSVAAVTKPDAAGMFKLTAVGVGKARIIVKATDPDDAPAQWAFDVGVGSKAPMLTNVSNVVALVLQDGMRTETLDLMSYFTDPEGDDLTFAIADEGNSSIATVTDPVINGMITITAVAEGKTMIEVTAKDSDNDPVSLMLDVRVSDEPNHAPELVSQIGGQSLELDFDQQMKTVNVSANFTDPDVGDTLTYAAASSMEEYVEASAEGSMITITAIAAGKATITVTASDGKDSVNGTFDVTVTAPAEPTWKKEIADETFEHDDGPKTFMLADYFNRATMYDATSDDEDVVKAAVNTEQTMVTLTRVGAGRAVVEIAPSNSGGTGAVQSITVTVKASPLGPALMKGKSFDDIKKVKVKDTDTHKKARVSNGIKDYDLTVYIHDPDGFAPNTLTFSTATSDPTTVAVYEPPSSDETVPTAAQLKQTKVAGKDVTVRARKAGSAVIKVVATDISGEDKSWTFTVTVVADKNNEPTVESTTLPKEFGSLDGTARFKSTDTAPKKLKIDLALLFKDTDVEEKQRATGDWWRFNPVSSDKDVVTVELESTGNSTKPDEYNVVITPVGSGIADVHFTVTDSFGKMAGEVGKPGFKVMVNSRPKAEGAQTPPETLAELSEKYKNLAVLTGFDKGADQVTLVVENGGYFSDGDPNDTLTCRFDPRGVDIFAADYPKWNDAKTKATLVLGKEDTTIKSKGTAYVDVWCTDGFEESPVATLTIEVVSQGSMH